MTNTSARGGGRARTAPGPRPGLLLGSARLAMVDDLSAAWQEQHDVHGDTFSMRMGPPRLGYRLTVTRDPESIGAVLGATSPFAKNGHPFFEAFRDVLGKGLFSAYDDDWRWQRRVLQPMFTAKQSAGYAGLVHRRADEATTRWLSADGPLSLRSEILRLTLVIVTDLLFGVGRDDLADRLEETFPVISRHVIDRAFNPFSPPRSAPLPAVRRRERAVAEVYRLVDDVLASATVTEDSFVGRLREATDPETGRGFTESQIRDQVLVFIAAGHDTTATALTMAMQLLGLHPEAQQRAADEVTAMGPVASAEDVDRLVWTTAALDETMRLYPSAPGTGRRATADTVVDGFHVPAGSNVYTNFWAVHRHPDLWTDPAAFDPQRFLDVPATKRPRHTYLPFGSGPHACIGAHTAVLEMQVILATVLQRARVVATTRDMPVTTAITLAPAVPLPARFLPRT